MIQETMAAAPPVVKSDKMPSAVPYIIGNEAAERFSYYGMKTILTTFIAAQFFSHQANPDAHANAITHLFVFSTYFMSILGGVLADSYLGKYRTILWLSLLYVAGQGCLAIFTTNEQLFMLGLLLITLGAGGIKPCVSANVGDQFDKTNQHLLSKMFGWFYFAINAGSLVSTWFTPIFKHLPDQNWGGVTVTGPMIAFGVPGVLMAIATFIFWLGRKKYVKVPPKKLTRQNFIFISFYALFNAGKKKKGEGILDVAKGSFPDEAVENIKAVWRVLAVFAFIPAFWALYDQNGSEWVLQATHMNLTTNLGFMSYTWLPEQVQMVNPILILAFIPLFSYIIYPAIEKMGIKVTPLRKIGTGFLFTALSFVVIAFIQTRIDAGETPNIGWQVLAYIIITIAEILISISGLEYAYTNAPPAMKSTVMACWLSTVAVGNLFVTLINANISAGGFLAQLKGANYYWFFFGVVCTFALVFIIVSKRFKETSYMITEDDNAVDPNLIEN